MEAGSMEHAPIVALTWKGDNMPKFGDFTKLTGAIQLEYLPTPKSRKWRKGPIRLIYSQLAFDDAVTLAAQENWHTWRYVQY